MFPESAGTDSRPCAASGKLLALVEQQTSGMCAGRADKSAFRPDLAARRIPVPGFGVWGPALVSGVGAPCRKES